ncbi:MAG: helix-turn-helix transcriptional regulator [Clostridia bacterium]
MLFSEKLYKLRKENGLSQEELAEKLNTTRQAVSKWENNQGYPETEKLLMMSNIFNVSVDYLLKDSNENVETDDKGFYASKEMIEEYFLNRKDSLSTICIGVCILMLGIGAYFKFAYENMSPIIMTTLLVLGGVITMKGFFKANDKFEVLQKEILIFDKNYQMELLNRYKNKITKVSSVFGISFVIFLLSAAPIARDIKPFTKDFSNGIPLSFEIIFIAFSIATPIMIYCGEMMETYKSIVDNEKHINSFTFKLRKKVRMKWNSFLK